LGFKKIRGNEGEIIIETKVVEGITNRVLSRWKVLKEDFPSVVRILNEKFNLGIIKRKRKEDKDKDLAWTR